MNSVAIVAIVAMLLTFFVMMREGEHIVASRAEVILNIDPPPVWAVGFPPPMPDRNPKR
jgi:hypothetical protein